MIELALIPLCAALNRFRGGGVVLWNIPGRKFIAAALTGAAFGVIIMWGKI